MRILLVSSEIVPFAKTGGLADVAGALPLALAARQHDVRVVLPRYRSVRLDAVPSRRRLTLPIRVGARQWPVTVYESQIPHSRVTAYFIDQPEWFDRDGLYQHQGKDFPDNLTRFAGFAHAVLGMLPQLDWMPQVIHANDWQSALVPTHLATTLQSAAWAQELATVFTIHNLAYQGTFPQDQWELTGLPGELFTMEGLEYHGQLCLLKGGILYADVITTVSPTYAKEIQTPEFGCGLDGLLRTRADRLFGVLNGIDEAIWNPARDAVIAARYTPKNLRGKSQCKRALLRSQRLPDDGSPLIGIISRLADQKGFDLLAQAMPTLMERQLQFVILGTGDPKYHELLQGLAQRYPNKLALNLTFHDPLAHAIEAGSDMFLMPSRYEPCGLNQMMSLRYGTIPIVRKTGGLADTVVDATPEAVRAKRANGFVFEPYTATALREAVERALAACEHRALWQQLIGTGMRQDFSWAHAARQYVELYKRACSLHPTSSLAR